MKTKKEPGMIARARKAVRKWISNPGELTPEGKRIVADFERRRLLKAERDRVNAEDAEKWRTRECGVTAEELAEAAAEVEPSNGL